MFPDKGSLFFTSVHEVYPGHFVQFLHANRSNSKFGQIFVGYAFAEGWAHYCEEMMYEAGLGEGDPELHIGQLQEALLSDVRFLRRSECTRKMTVAESKKMFIEQGLQSRRGRTAVGPRHVRPGLSELHDGQADDPEAPR